MKKKKLIKKRGGYDDWKGICWGNYYKWLRNKQVKHTAVLMVDEFDNNKMKANNFDNNKMQAKGVEK